MSTKLESLIQSHASQFATAIVAALKGMSIEDIVGHRAGAASHASHTTHTTHSAPAAAAPAKRGPGRPKKAASAASAPAPKAAAKSSGGGGGGGRRIRRSADDIAGLLDQVVSWVASNPGSRSEHIVSGLGIDKKLLPRPIAEGLKSGALSKTGEKRATQYFAGGAGGGKKGKKK